MFPFFKRKKSNRKISTNSGGNDCETDIIMTTNLFSNPSPFNGGSSHNSGNSCDFGHSHNALHPSDFGHGDFGHGDCGGSFDSGGDSGGGCD